MKFPASELILNDDGSIYHLHLHPEQISDLIITVGDPDRVGRVSRHFDRIDTKVNKREFVTHTGELGGRRMTVISTGIGTDNIDIVFNELDALARIDLQKRDLLDQQRSLTFVRLGTSGALQADLELDSFLLSSYGLGLDGLMAFYDFSWPEQSQNLLNHLETQLAVQGLAFPLKPYLAPASDQLLAHFAGPESQQGITLTATGFYGPQARQIRLKSKMTETLLQAVVNWEAKTPSSGSFPGPLRVTNFEMETAGIYGLAHALGHRALSVSALLANRPNGTFSETPGPTVDRLIEWALAKLQSL
ncbi:MAG: nucleoside phosphorylase [Bacteroidota bacterium]